MYLFLDFRKDSFFVAISIADKLIVSVNNNNNNIRLITLEKIWKLRERGNYLTTRGLNNWFLGSWAFAEPSMRKRFNKRKQEKTGCFGIINTCVCLYLVLLEFICNLFVVVVVVPYYFFVSRFWPIGVTCIISNPEIWTRYKYMVLPVRLS